MIQEFLGTPDFSDERGTITDILYKQEFQHAAIITTPNASVDNPVYRGDHYHKESTQAIYILSGMLTYYYSDVDRFKPTMGNIQAPAGTLITTSPYEIHALEILEPTVFIAFSDGLRGGKDYESDTYRVTPSIIAHRTDK